MNLSVDLFTLFYFGSMNLFEIALLYQLKVIAGPSLRRAAALKRRRRRKTAGMSASAEVTQHLSEAAWPL